MEDDLKNQKTFSVPVDTENKSKVLKVWSFQYPHHLCFHLNWLSFFIGFFATFAAPPLIPVIRNDLDLTKPDLGNAAIASVTGAVFARIITGGVCDALGPRYGHGFIQLLTSMATFGMATVNSSGGFIACRMCIGFSLATFVCCQFWCTVLFSQRILATANATGAGWGNLGGGVTQLVMPFIFQAIASDHPQYIAWRLSFWVPAFSQVLIGLIILRFGVDLPDGNYADLKASGTMAAATPALDYWFACKNYRTWILVLNYGYCFGVELTVNNQVSPYLYDNFDLTLQTAGLLGSVFGLMNLFARSLGGVASDLAVKRFGMRGRLWALYLTQTLCGLGSFAVFYAKGSLGATMAVIIFFSLFVQMAEGASYGVVPFVSRRSLGVISGLVGAGGNAGSGVTQALFFTSTKYTTAEGFKWMGVMVMAVTTTLALVHFPMWGSMFLPGDPSKTEEEYYTADFTEKEKAAGKHHSVMKFANESKSQKGFHMAEEVAKLEGKGALV